MDSYIKIKHLKKYPSLYKLALCQCNDRVIPDSYGTNPPYPEVPLTHVFIWSDSPQGDKFWRNIHDQWFEKLDIYTFYHWLETNPMYESYVRDLDKSFVLENGLWYNDLIK